MMSNKLVAAVLVASTAMNVPALGTGTALAQPADFAATAGALVEAAYPADWPPISFRK